MGEARPPQASKLVALMLSNGSPVRDRNETLPQSWLKHSAGIGIAEQSMPLLSRLIACWSEPHRHYQTLRHLQECLQLLEEWGAPASAAS